MHRRGWCVIRYTAGYGPQDSDGFGELLPASCKGAMKLMVGHFHAHREAAMEVALSTVPLGVHSRLRPYRVLLGMA